MNWQATLESRGYLLSDGAWGTELAKLGLPPVMAPEQWNADCPDAVESVARRYVEAGADVILTDSFGGTRWKLEKAGLADRTAELNRRAAEISRRAAAGRALVFASVGPTGEFMAPLGPKTEAEFIDVFAEQIGSLMDGGADGIVVETMSAIEEAVAALKAARRVGRFPVVVSMTYARGARGFATVMGVTPERAAEELDKAGADAVGSNCGNGVANMIEVTRLMRRRTARPLWVKANAGMPALVGGRTVFPESPEEMAGRVGDLFAAGANIIGGCCGTTPEHIRAMAQAARKRDA